MLTYESRFWQDHPGQNLAGIDEAGRGCLAGNVVAGAVMMRPEVAHHYLQNDLAQINDSKQLTPKKRELLYHLLTTLPDIQIGVGQASPQEIDQINILRATHLAMRRAIEALPTAADFALVDGLPVKGLPIDHQAIVKGDAKAFLIACASIIAKVTRDHQLIALDSRYPAYGFAAHKGYCAKRHLTALTQHGPCPEHRMTFAPVAATLDNLPGL